MRRSPLPLLIGLVVLVAVVLMALIPIVGGMLTAGGGGATPSLFAFGEKIVILEVEGVLGEGPGYGADSKRLREVVQRWAADSSVKGMVLRVNSPGGTVSATQDLFEAINRFAEEKPVIASMGDIAASGGYYVAMAADEVYANPGTLTGSVGVIMSFWGYKDLVDKIGLEPRTIKSGQFKDIGSGARPMTDEERAMLESTVADVHEQFFEVVSGARFDAAAAVLAAQSGRQPKDITDEEIEAHLRTWCDGRIFSGRQALDSGMVDHVGTFDEALEHLKAHLGVKDTVRIVRTPRPQPSFFGVMRHQLQNAAPGTVRLEFRFTM